MIIAPEPRIVASLWRGGKLPSFFLPIVRRLEDYQEEMTMTKLTLIGIATVAAATAFAAPAFAQHRVAHFANTYAQANVCGSQESGNPYSKEEDYIAWSAWRARGGWDDRVDTNCLSSRMGRGGF
jgi:hypothetical protein